MWICRFWSFFCALFISGIFQSVIVEYSFWFTHALILLCFVLIQEICFNYYEMDILKRKIENQRLENYLINSNVQTIDKDFQVNHQFLVEFQNIKSQLWNIEKTLNFQMQSLKYKYRRAEMLQKDSKNSKSFNGFSSEWN